MIKPEPTNQQQQKIINFRKKVLISNQFSTHKKMSQNKCKTNALVRQTLRSERDRVCVCESDCEVFGY